MGRDPNRRMALISNTGEQAEKFLGQIKEIIEGSSEIAERYRRVFPHVKRGSANSKKNRAWGNNAIIIERSLVSPDYTLCAIGVGKKFLGARFDDIIFDDILDFENTATEGQRNKTWTWITSTALTRLVADGKAIFITTAWHLEDAAYKAEETGEWHTIRTPAIKTLPNGDPDWNSTPAWPENWPIERLKKKYKEVGAIEFARSLLCSAISDAMSRFKESSFVFALEAGKNYSMVNDYKLFERDGKWFNTLPVFAGVDLNIKKQRTSDDTVLFVGCLHPTGLRQILKIIRDKMEGMDIIDQLVQLKSDFPKLIGVYVEDNGAQDYLLQFARQREGVPPIHGFTTTERKYDPLTGIPSLSAEMDQGMWIFPSKEREESGVLHPEISYLIQRLRTWTPREHTPDNVMGMWFFREAVVDMHVFEDVKTDQSKIRDSMQADKQGFSDIPIVPETVHGSRFFSN